MKWRVSEDAAAAARDAAGFIAARLSQAVEERGRASFAISGGSSPWPMFEHLASQDMDWRDVHVFQVDERIVPIEHPERNWKRFLENPLAQRVPDANRHPMPVGLEDHELAAGRYTRTLSEYAGTPPELDVVHLGLGEDGHTASLFADDSLLRDQRHWVGTSHVHEGYRRLTLTLPVLNRAAAIVWFAVGASRRAILTRLHEGDPEIAASHVRREGATCFTDRDAVPAAVQRS